MRTRSMLVALVAAAAACGSSSSNVKPEGAGGAVAGIPPAPVAPPPVSKTEYSGYDEANLDRSVDPCDDFYKFACGGWMKRTEIPADKARWGSFGEIDEHNRALLRKVLEADAAGQGNPSDAYNDKLGNFWASCMDESAIEASSKQDLAGELAKIDAIKSKDGLVHEVAHLHLGVANPMFRFQSDQDFKDATQVIGVFDQGGLGLPDRDFYLKDDAKSKALRAAYEEHVGKMLALAGEAPAKAAADARTVMALETRLAKASLTRVERREPKNIYHRIELAGLEKTAPHMPWKTFLKDLGYPSVTTLNVTHPPFFAALDAELANPARLGDWKTYLRWHLVHGAAPALAKAFVDENFHFYGQTLNGTKEIEPRWKRCVSAIDHMMGEALAQPFVRESFGSSGKQRTKDLVALIEASMEEDLAQLSWMDDATRAQAKDKLAHIANKIGYPDKWRSYDKLEIGRRSFFQNMIAGAMFETRRDLDKIGKPVDRGEWDMTPPTVNAYYNPSMNEMVFPAGILQPPFYNNAARPSVNFGGIGMVMGHELTHGFDDEGRKFDAVGNLREWWSPKVGEEFEQRAACVAKQFDGYVAVDDLHLNGKLTLGENIADLGGMKLAFHAWRKFQEKQRAAAGGQGGVVENAAYTTGGAAAGGKFTDDQLFFLGIAQAWCSKTRPENARMRVVTDPHSPPEYRVNGPLSNTPEFAQAFQCKPGAKMIRQNACSIW